MGHRFFNFSVLVFLLRSVLVQLSYTRIIRGLARSLPKFVTGVTALSFIYSSFFFLLDWIGNSAAQCNELLKSAIRIAIRARTYRRHP